MRLTIAENVAVRALAHPDRAAIEVLGQATLTYGEVWRRVVALAGAIGDVEAGPHGRMVAILLGNSADAALAYLACQWAGVAAVPVNNRLAAPEVTFVVGDCGARLILTDQSFADVAAKVAGDCGAQLVVAETVPTPFAVERPLLGEAARGGAPCVVGYTSGTTGFPKGALYSNDHYLTALMRWGWEFGLTADQVMLVPGPLFHLSYAGLSMAALCIGARIRIMPNFDAATALAELSERCSFAFLVPSMTGMIAEEWRRRGEPPVPAMRLMLSSGAPGPLSLTQTAMRMFNSAKVCEAYGWTEGGWVTFEAKQPESLLAHSVGWPCFGNEVGVFREDGSPCGVGEAGEVGVKSLTHFDGYIGRPEATAAAWRNGWFHTGDAFRYDEDGNYYFVDRIKDAIRRRGENISSFEVEAYVLRYPSVAEAAAVAVPSEHSEDEVKVIVVPKAGEEFTPEGLIRFLIPIMPRFMIPRYVQVADALPKTPTLRVKKAELRGGGAGEDVWDREAAGIEIPKK